MLAPLEYSNMTLQKTKKIHRDAQRNSLMGRGFTLIESVVYIALLGFLMSAVLLSVFSISQNSSLFTAKTSASDEGAFVVGKLNWAFGDLRSVNTPSSGYGQSLTIIRNDGTQVDVRLSGGVLQMKVGSGSYIDLTTGNVQVTSIGFQNIAGTPSGIEASTTINGTIFTTRRYLRN